MSSKSSSIVDKISDYKVSSVLNNDRKVYGKKFLFDRKDETCWNSDQGTPQWIHFNFDKPVTVTGFILQFQGGFAGKDCELGTMPSVEGCSEDQHPQPPPQIGNDLDAKPFQFLAQDTNSVQEFSVPNGLSGSRFYLKFLSSTDFYGRIILYNFDIFGETN